MPFLSFKLLSMFPRWGSSSTGTDHSRTRQSGITPSCATIAFPNAALNKELMLRAVVGAKGVCTSSSVQEASQRGCSLYGLDFLEGLTDNELLEEDQPEEPIRIVRTSGKE